MWCWEASLALAHCLAALASVGKGLLARPSFWRWEFFGNVEFGPLLVVGPFGVAVFLFGLAPPCTTALPGMTSSTDTLPLRLLGIVRVACRQGSASWRTDRLDPLRSPLLPLSHRL